MLKIKDSLDVPVAMVAVVNESQRAVNEPQRDEPKSGRGGRGGKCMGRGGANIDSGWKNMVGKFIDRVNDNTNSWAFSNGERGTQQNKTKQRALLISKQPNDVIVG
jgi:hypothetical protein